MSLPCSWSPPQILPSLPTGCGRSWVPQPSPEGGGRGQGATIWARSRWGRPQPRGQLAPGAPDGALHIPQALLEMSPGTQSLNPAVPKLMKFARGAAVIAPVPAPSRSTGQVTAPNAPRPKPGGLVICTPRGETPGKRHFCSEKPPAVGALARFGLCR